MAFQSTVDSVHPKNTKTKKKTFDFKLTTKITLLASIITLASTPLLFESYKEFMNDNGAKKQLRTNLIDATNGILPIIAQWNQTVEMSSDDIYARFVNSKFKAQFQLYEKAGESISELSPLTQASYKWQLAKLYIIKADMVVTSKSHTALDMLSKAEKLLDESEEILSNNHSSFSERQTKYLTDTNLEFRIKRTKLNVLAFQQFIKPDKAKELEADLLLTDEELLDCENLTKELGMKHRKILSGLGCKTA